MKFGEMLEAIKMQECAGYRKGWNGKGMFIYYVPAATYPAQTDIAKKYFGESISESNPKVPYKAYIAMKCVDEEVVPWLASQTDILAEDWEITEL